MGQTLKCMSREQKAWWSAETQGGENVKITGGAALTETFPCWRHAATPLVHKTNQPRGKNRKKEACFLLPEQLAGISWLLTDTSINLEEQWQFPGIQNTLCNKKYKVFLIKAPNTRFYSVLQSDPIVGSNYSFLSYSVLLSSNSKHSHWNVWRIQTILRVKQLNPAQLLLNTLKKTSSYSVSHETHQTHPFSLCDITVMTNQYYYYYAVS